MRAVLRAFALTVLVAVFLVLMAVSVAQIALWLALTQT